MVPDSDERSGVPRWVKLVVIIGLLVAALVVVLVLGGGHVRPPH